MLRSELYQFDLVSPSIYSSQKTIHTSNNVAGALQLAIDGGFTELDTHYFSSDIRKCQ